MPHRHRQRFHACRTQSPTTSRVVHCGVSLHVFLKVTRGYSPVSRSFADLQLQGASGQFHILPPSQIASDFIIESFRLNKPRSGIAEGASRNGSGDTASTTRPCYIIRRRILIQRTRSKVIVYSELFLARHSVSESFVLLKLMVWRRL